MKKIMIDMDDVIVDLSAKFLGAINHVTNKNYTIEEFGQYHMQDIIPEELKEKWIKYIETYNFYEGIEIFEDAVEVISKIQEKYEMYLGTAYLFKEGVTVSGNHLKNKYDYLIEKLPEIKPESFVFISNKEILDCDIKIDDRIDNLTGKASVKLLFTAYHNKDIADEELKEKNVIRVNNWKEIEKILI